MFNPEYSGISNGVQYNNILLYKITIYYSNTLIVNTYIPSNQKYFAIRYQLYVISFLHEYDSIKTIVYTRYILLYKNEGIDILSRYRSYIPYSLCII